MLCNLINQRIHLQLKMVEKAHVSKAKKGMGLASNQIAIGQVQAQQVVNLVQQPPLPKKLFEDFNEFFDEHMDDLKRCDVETDRDEVIRLLKEATATFRPDKMEFPAVNQKIALRAGVPVFKETVDLLDWSIKVYQPTKIMKLLMP